MHLAPTSSCWRGLEDLRPVVLRFLSRRCRDEHEAEDLAQETLLRAARYRKGAMECGRLASWLVQIAANVQRDHARREGRGPRSMGEDDWLDAVEDPRPATGSPGLEGALALGEHSVDVEDALSYLSAALTRLVERDRAVLSAYYSSGECTRTTASECGIHHPLVKVRLFRARRRLERLVLQRASQQRSPRMVLTA